MNQTHKFCISGIGQEHNAYVFKHLVEVLKSDGFAVFLFGSRASQNHTKYSDIDILVSTKENKDIKFVRKAIGEVKTFFEQSDFPYILDIVLKDDLEKSYLQNIANNLIEL